MRYTQMLYFRARKTVSEKQESSIGKGKAGRRFSHVGESLRDSRFWRLGETPLRGVSQRRCDVALFVHELFVFLKQLLNLLVQFAGLLQGFGQRETWIHAGAQVSNMAQPCVMEYSAAGAH